MVFKSKTEADRLPVDGLMAVLLQPEAQVERVSGTRCRTSCWR